MTKKAKISHDLKWPKRIRIKQKQTLTNTEKLK